MHIIGAIFFFAVIYVSAGTVSIVVSKMRSWNTAALSKEGTMLKVLIMVLISMVVIYCVIGLILEDEDDENDNDIYIVIVEWNLMLGWFVWLWTFVFDWKDVKLVLKGNFRCTVRTVS